MSVPYHLDGRFITIGGLHGSARYSSLPRVHADSDRLLGVSILALISTLVMVF